MMRGNIGDPVLYYELENMYNHITGTNHYWIHRPIGRKTTTFEVVMYNNFAKALVIGGHGLLMPDAGRNNHSGWLFNFSKEHLEKIKIPIVVLAIGYNSFRNENDFCEGFGPHINKCVEKSVFFGLRNYGSINALKRYLLTNNAQKVKFQPCPTTMLSMYEKDIPSVSQQNVIVICLAFDKFLNRFGDCFDELINSLCGYCRLFLRRGYEVKFIVHSQTDANSIYARICEERGVPILCLSNRKIDEILSFYKSVKLVVGMRGHSLMIPWGMRIPVISLNTQDKQKWFIETTGHNERSIEIDDAELLPKLVTQTEYILNHYEDVIEDIAKKQNEFWNISTTNFLYIENVIQQSAKY